MTSVEPSRIWTRLDLRADGKQAGHLHVPHSVDRSAYGTIAIPCGIIAGNTGPTVLLMGGVHGDEYEAQLVLSRIFRRIDASQVSGRLIFLPSYNLPAAIAGRRTSPLDDLNLNRIYPGDPDGSPTMQLAYFTETVLAPLADVWFDLHSGGGSLDYLPLLAVHAFGDEAMKQRTMFLVRSFGMPVSLVWRFFDEPRMGKGCAERHGLIYVNSELGGGGGVDATAVQLAYDGLLRSLVALRVLEASAIPIPPAGPTRLLEVRGRDDYVYASAAGVFEPVCPIGAEVRAGDKIGYICQIDDISAEPVPQYARAEGLLVCRRHPARVERGDCLVHLAEDIG